jgi:GT2 family glycosyltransferase
MRSEVDIIIINWNSKDYLRLCLKSLEVMPPGISFEVIVVDSASFDGCADMLHNEFPRVKFVQSLENVGFGRANNLGATKATAPLLLLLNPDTELHGNALREMVNCIVGVEGAGAVGPRLLNSDGSLQTSCVMAFPSPLNQALDSEALRSFFPRSQLWGCGRAFSEGVPTEVAAVSGACMLVRTETFQRVGGFSPEYFMYGEDVDLCTRIRNLGLRVLHTPSAEVVHHGGGSSKRQISGFATVQMRAANYLLIKRHSGRARAMMYRLLQAVSAVLRIMVVAPVYPLLPRPQKERAAQTLTKWLHVLGWAVRPNPCADGTRAGRKAKASATNASGLSDQGTRDNGEQVSEPR